MTAPPGLSAGRCTSKATSNTLRSELCLLSFAPKPKFRPAENKLPIRTCYFLLLLVLSPGGRSGSSRLSGRFFVREPSRYFLLSSSLSPSFVLSSVLLHSWAPSLRPSVVRVFVDWVVRGCLCRGRSDRRHSSASHCVEDRKGSPVDSRSSRCRRVRFVLPLLPSREAIRYSTVRSPKDAEQICPVEAEGRDRRKE